MKILRIQDLSYSIGSKIILKKVNFEISLGETYVLRGDNGAGKSTLLKLILNYNHHKDHIQWLKPNNPKRQLLSYLGHELGLYTSLSLEENLRFFKNLTQDSYSWEKIQEWVELCNLHRRWEDPLYSFSRGMKQKAAIIRSILVRPMLLLLDEPFTGLDDKSYPIVRDILLEVKKDSAILGVVHGMEDGFWEKNLVLRGGVLECS